MSARSAMLLVVAAAALAACGLPRPGLAGGGGKFATATGVETSGKPFALLRFTPSHRAQIVAGTSLARHPSGDLVIAGRFGGEADVGLGAGRLGGDLTSFVGRYTPQGQPRWVRWTASASGDDGPRVVVDKAGNVIVASSGRSAMRPFGQHEPACQDRSGCPIVPRIDILSADGETRLAKAFPTADARERMRPHFVGTDASGDVTVAGHFGSASDLFVARYAASTGERRWFTRIRSVATANIAGLTVLPRGDVVVLGDSDAELRIDDLVSPAKVKSGTGFFLRVDGESGLLRWMRRLEADGGSSGLAITSDDAGDVYIVAKELTGSRWSALVQKVSPATGDPLWTRRMRKPYNTILGASIDVTRDGAPVIAFKLLGGGLETGLELTQTSPESDRSTSMVVALSSEGTSVWARELRTPSNARSSWSLEATSVASLGPTEAVVTGWFSGRAELGDLRAEGPWLHRQRECFDEDDEGWQTRRDCGEEWAARAMFVARIAP